MGLKVFLNTNKKYIYIERERERELQRNWRPRIILSSYTYIIFELEKLK